MPESPLDLLSKVPTVEPEEWMTLGKLEGSIIDVASPEAEVFLEATRSPRYWSNLWTRRERVFGDIAKPKTILVFGSSGSGKSTVVRTIAEEFTDKVLLQSCDHYYGPFGQIENNGLAVFSNNYDHPASIDWKLLIQHHQWLGEKREVNLPVYDFSTHSRVRGVRRVEPAPIILIEGIMAAHALKDKIKADLILAIDTPFETAMERRIKRDVTERGRSEEISKLQIEQTVKPGHYQFVEPYLNMARNGEWPNVILVDNGKDAPFGKEPARVNSKGYLSAIEKLLA
jgi:uridine kinase